MALFHRKHTESSAAEAHRRSLIEHMTFEVIPLNSLDAAIEQLPAGAQVSVTCSPTKGIEATQRTCELLVQRGFTPVPHISARMIGGRAHTDELASWCRDLGLGTAFVVGGDSADAAAYPGAVEFLTDFLDAAPGLSTIGVTSYPDGHPLIADDILRWALHEKQRLLEAAGIAGYCSTQMCFDPATITAWLRDERAQGLRMPVHLGISGVVDKTKLLTMGARLGVGDSVKYLRKNMGAVIKMMTAVNYDPNDLLVPLSDDLVELGVEGLHVFTFNQVAATNAWRTQALGLS